MILGGALPTPIPVFDLGQPFAVGVNGRLVPRRKGGGAPDLSPELVTEIETISRVVGEYMLLRAVA